MAYGAWAGQRWRTVWNNGYYRVDVLWDYCQDIANNKTMVALCSQRCTSLNGYYSFVYTATEVGFGDFNGTKHGTTASVSVPGGGSHTVNLSHLHCEVSHNADGTWNNNLCGWWRYNVPLGGQNHSPNIGWTAFGGLGDTIPTIPRATTPTLSAGTVAMGSAVTINLPRASTVFTHVVTYRFGSASGTISSNATTSYSWTPPVTLAQQIKSSTSGVGTITVQTKNGSTVIGTKTINITLTVPASVVPTISAHTAVEATANLASKFGALVQSKSTLKVTTTAAGAQGSTITAYKTEVDGRSYTGSPCTTAALSRSGTVAVKTTVTDSRGRTASHTVNVTVVAYSPPQISVSNVARTSDEATTGTCTYNYSISSVGSKNDKAFYIQYLSGSTWTDITRMSDSYGKSGSVTSGAVFGVDATTKVRFVAQDYFTSVVVEKEVGPTFTLMNLGAGGKSLAIGRVSDNEGTYQCALAQTHAHRTSASGVNGYLKILQLVVTATAWNYGGIEFKYHCGAVGTSWFDTGKIVINGGRTTDPTPAIVMCSNPDNPIYLHKASANTWDVYVAKNGLEQAFVFDVVQFRANRIKWSFQNQQVASLPSGYIRARWEHLNACYPVGSVKFTYDANNPGIRLGGTWAQFSQGRTLIGQGTGSDGTTSMTFGAGATGGEYKHKLAQSEMPSHSHWLSDDANHTAHSFAWGGAGKTVWLNTLAAGGNGSGNVANTKQNEWNHTAYDGGNGLHNNVQPYQVIYAWRRTG
ncbi:DUF859 family phage minor structural protein [Faecalibaculum rodentium]|uniref:DUF859 family phage minor structural protein n=1 Tax=Faecalibaculum rodentium TaxID=1702221 RepID=UPI0025B679B7|nr:DUF859 family phage minor structural protein [Faecalibaculum rodentium]